MAARPQLAHGECLQAAFHKGKHLKAIEDHMKMREKASDGSSMGIA